MVNNFNKYKLNILGIIDHKIVHKNDQILFQKFDNCTLITTSSWINSNGAASGVIGLLISKTSEQALAEVKPINDRIVITVFNGNPKTSVVINYAPIEGNKEAEEHYYNLTNLTNSIPKHHMIIECGDFTKLESADMRQIDKSNLSNLKTSGSDNFTSEVIKCDFDNIILEFSNKLLNDNDIQDQWSEIDMLPLPKTCDLSETSNYRGISISSKIAKTVNKMILNRIMTGRLTTSHILALRK